MKYYLLLSLLLPITASASQWTTVRLDHFNQLYSAGETATLQVEVTNLPVDPAYGVYVTIQKVGSAGAPTPIPLTGGVGAYVSAPLAAGAPSFEVVTHFTGPATSAEPAFDQIVQDDVIPLQVNQ